MNGAPSARRVLLILVKGARLAPLPSRKRHAQEHGHDPGAAAHTGGVSQRISPRHQVEDEERRLALREEREQALILYDEEGQVTVVQPNEDGSYWRKIVRNKMIRMKEKRRELAAQAFVSESLGIANAKEKVVSSWGPYTSTVGTAKATGVAGLTKPSKL